jgi:hypothetical protein
MYVVTGLPRSGTSMMMRCIALSSNIPHVVDPEYEAKIVANELVAGANPNGHWVADLNKKRNVTNKLIKVPLHRGLFISKDSNVIFMNRDMQKIATSYYKYFGEELTESFMTICKSAEKYIRTVANVIDVNYEDVINDPRTEFERIQNAGWIFDIEKAIILVDKNLNRTTI